MVLMTQNTKIHVHIDFILLTSVVVVLPTSSSNNVSV